MVFIQPLTLRYQCSVIPSYPFIQRRGAPPQTNEIQTNECNPSHSHSLLLSFRLFIHLLLNFQHCLTPLLRTQRDALGQREGGRRSRRRRKILGGGVVKKEQQIGSCRWLKSSKSDLLLLFFLFFLSGRHNRPSPHSGEISSTFLCKGTLKTGTDASAPTKAAFKDVHANIGTSNYIYRNV